MSVSGMRPLEGATLYSVMDKLPRTLSCTLEKSRAKQSEWQGQFPSIKDLIQTNALPFFVSKVNPDVSIDMDSRSISLEDGHVQQICLQGWVPQVCFCFSFTCFSKHSLTLNFVSCAVRIIQLRKHPSGHLGGTCHASNQLQLHRECMLPSGGGCCCRGSQPHHMLQSVQAWQGADPQCLLCLPSGGHTNPAAGDPLCF